jgi:EKC/KEOPS complex subunit CGI121/TPRKB
METITLPHLPNSPIQVCLFKNVQNAAFLRQQLLEGNTDFEYAFLDASVLVSRSHVLAACFRAISDSLNGRLKSRNVHSEIVFSLSPNNNVSQCPHQNSHSHSPDLQIAESFRRFGIQDTSTHVVAVKVLSSPEQSFAEHLSTNVQGEPVAMTDEALASVKDDARIRKIYRLDQPKKGESAVLGKKAEAFVIGSMALKGA